MFELHPNLSADCEVLGDFTLCRLLLMKDATFPWLILVPRREGVREIYQLSWEDQQQFLRESSAVCSLLEKQFSPYKLNVAALGNMVPQLHVHHIARFETDPAWPRPVWGALAPTPYEAAALADLRAELCAQLQGCGEDFQAQSGDPEK